MTSYIDLAYKVSARSTHKQHHLAAVVVRGGSVLAMAANRGDWGKCAERRALGKCKRGKTFDAYGAVMFVIRSNGSMSRPCKHCRPVIKEAGIKKVIYIDWNGKVVVERVDEHFVEK